MSYNLERKLSREKMKSFVKSFRTTNKVSQQQLINFIHARNAKLKDKSKSFEINLKSKYEICLMITLNQLEKGK